MGWRACGGGGAACIPNSAFPSTAFAGNERPGARRGEESSDRAIGIIKLVQHASAEHYAARIWPLDKNRVVERFIQVRKPRGIPARLRFFPRSNRRGGAANVRYKRAKRVTAESSWGYDPIAMV